MRISFASILTAAAFFGAATASPHKSSYKGHHAVPKGKAFDHILQVWFENQNFDTVAAVPAFQAFLKRGILLDNFNAITHPSEANYVAAAGGSTFGIDDDDYYNIPENITSIFELLDKKGLSWKVYQENLPYAGFTGYDSYDYDGTYNPDTSDLAALGITLAELQAYGMGVEDLNSFYARRHNPAASFDYVSLHPERAKKMVPATEFAKDIKADNLPNWMFYTPNVYNDGHNTNATYAGKWLTGFYEKTLSNPKLLEKTLILLTFDESAGSASGAYPARNRVWSLLLGAVPEKLKGTTDSTFYTHFSTLNTVERNWDLGSLGRQDANRTVSNVFEFAAKALDYKNIQVREDQIPFANNSITGLLTGKSWNETHPTDFHPPA